jgi:hypothetical protein
MPPTIYFHRVVTVCDNKYIVNLRTIKVCNFNSVSISGGQLIMYQQLIFKLYRGSVLLGLMGKNMRLKLLTENRL